MHLGELSHELLSGEVWIGIKVSLKDKGYHLACVYSRVGSYVKIVQVASTSPKNTHYCQYTLAKANVGGGREGWFTPPPLAPPRGNPLVCCCLSMQA